MSAKVSNWHFKRNILGKMIVLSNQCINLCPEKCNLCKIPIASTNYSQILPIFGKILDNKIHQLCHYLFLIKAYHSGKGLKK